MPFVALYLKNVFPAPTIIQLTPSNLKILPMIGIVMKFFPQVINIEKIKLLYKLNVFKKFIEIEHLFLFFRI